MPVKHNLVDDEEVLAEMTKESWPPQPPFIGPAIHRLPIITAASRIIWKPSSKYEERFERTYGFFRPYLQKVIYRYLDCGDLHNGFARVKCKDCNHEYLLAFSCKRRHFCPSCHQKRVVEFGEWLCANVLKKVPHRHFVFSIPKIRRRYHCWYSNVGRGKREKLGEGETIPHIIESDR